MTRMSTPTVPTLVHRIAVVTRERAEFQRQADELEAENARLRAELAATMLPYKGHTIKIIGGVATVFLHGGAVYERVQRVIDRPGEAGYEWHWQKVESIPTSPADRIDAVAPALTEMGVLGEQLEVA